MPTRILALASEPLSADVLRAALGTEQTEELEVLVVAPALMSRARFVLAAPDPAINRAEQVQEESVERLEEEGVDAVGQTGSSDPLMAIEEALATFPADEIVLFTHGKGSRNWREEGLEEKARERFGAPVRQLEVES